MAQYRVTQLFLPAGASIDKAIERLNGTLTGGHAVTIHREDGITVQVAASSRYGQSAFGGRKPVPAVCDHCGRSRVLNIVTARFCPGLSTYMGYPAAEYRMCDPCARDYARTCLPDSMLGTFAKQPNAEDCK